MNLRTIHVTFDAAAEPSFSAELCALIDDADVRCFVRSSPASANDRVDYRELFLEDSNAKD